MNDVKPNGNVYLYNAYSESIVTLMVNGIRGDSIAGWQDGPEGQKYVPQALPVQRVLEYDGILAFNQGTNTINVDWSTFIGNTYEIDIPKTISLKSDMILYVTLNKAILMNVEGWVEHITDNGSPPSYESVIEKSEENICTAV